MSSKPLALATERLELVPLAADALEALIQQDRERLEALTAAHFPEPLQAPPLMEDALPSMRDELLRAGADPAWGVWLATARASREAIGCVALGRPDELGQVL